MLSYLVEVKIIGSGRCCRLKRNTKIPSVNWSSFCLGGYRFRTGDDCYNFHSPKIPHFLFWYYEKYHVEYFVWYRSKFFSWKNFLSIKHLHVDDGDIVIDEVNNVRYLMVNNPSSGQIEHHRIYD